MTKRPLRVMLVSSKFPPEYAGSGLRAFNTYQRLRRKFGVEVKVLTSSVTHNRSESYTLEELPVKRIANKRPVGAGQGNGRWARFKKRLLNFRNYYAEVLPTLFYLFRHHRWTDVVHIYGRVPVTSAATIYSKLTGKPLMVEIVNEVTDPHQHIPSWVAIFWGRRFPHTTRLVCISPALEKVCLAHGYSPEQIWERPNPIDTDKFQYQPKATHTQDSTRTLVYVAKFRPSKNQGFLLDVLHHLPANYHLQLLGPLVDSGPQAERDNAFFQSILDKAQELGLNDRVTIKAGFIENPQEFMQAADIYVIPSLTEGLGTPVLEAIACGTPVVANNLEGVFDVWVQDGKNGYICELDPALWAEKIQLAAQFSAAQMAKASAEVLAKASTAVIDQQYIDHLTQLAGRQHYA